MGTEGGSISPLTHSSFNTYIGYVNPLVTKRYIYAAYKKKNLDDLFLKVRQWDFQSFLSYILARISTN